MEIIVHGKQRRVTNIIGQGGEAEIYSFDADHVVKIFKMPTHPDFSMDKNSQNGAKIRLNEMQKKLPAFPKGLPTEVVSPVEIATNRKGLIVGYTMPFVSNAEVLYQYSDKVFRQAVPDEHVIDIFKTMHASVKKIHQHGVVLGDFNDLNVLVTQNGSVYLIDADSFQFGKFFCRLFTMRFVDPLLCDPKNQSVMDLIKPHNELSDWYAFNIMLFQCLLFAGPYSGVYRPKNNNNKVKHDARPLKRITVFNNEVKYPKPARHWNELSDDLLQHFHQVFEKDARIEFPLHLLEDEAWKRGDHILAPAAITEVVVIRGTVKSTRIFRTDGIIIKSVFQNGKLKYVYNECGIFYREDGTKVCAGNLEPNIRFGIKGKTTYIGKRSKVFAIKAEETETFFTDKFGNISSFDTNSKHLFWIQDGNLKKDGQYGPEHVGSVLTGQTMFWVGEHLGFGFYQAGEMNVGFVFDPDVKGINDSVDFPRIPGRLIDGSCYFTKNLAWVLYTVEEKKKTRNYCVVVSSDGKVLAKTSVDKDEESWLGNIKGKFVAGNFVLSATDDGIVRAEISGDSIVETKRFPDTEPFVSMDTRLFPGDDGIYAVNLKEIYLLKIS